MAITDIDERKLEAFIGHAATELGAALNAALVTLGDELGLYRAMADGQPVTPAELAARTGTQERYVREWLNAQAASGFVRARGRRLRAAARARARARRRVQPVPDDRLLPGRQRRRRRCASALAERFIDGDGVGWHEHHHDLWHGTERGFAMAYRTHLVADWLPALDGVVEKLEAGALVADVGCGHGASTILMAKAFPASRFVGVDYHAESIETARRRAAQAGVADRVTFEVAGAADCRARATTLSPSSTRSTTSATRSARPVTRRRRSPPAARACSSSRSPATRSTDNLNPIGRFYYGYSTLVCTPGSLSQPGQAGLGTQAGEARAQRGAAGRRVRRRQARRRDAAEPRPRGSPALNDRAADVRRPPPPRRALLPAPMTGANDDDAPVRGVACGRQPAVLYTVRCSRVRAMRAGSDQLRSRNRRCFRPAGLASPPGASHG